MHTINSSLLIRLRTREDSDAWRRFVRLYTPLVHHWISKVVRDRHQVDDLVQEIFIVLLDKVPMFGAHPPASFRGWLRIVTLNKCRDWCRQKKRKTEPVLLQQIESAIDDPGKLFTEQEYRQFLSRTALRLMRESFSESTWRACWEHVACGRKASEVAQELGISENAVFFGSWEGLEKT